MIRFCLFLLSIAFIVSCHRERPQNLLVGDWKRVQVDSMNEPPEPVKWEPGGRVYAFLNDSLVDTRRSYYKRVTSKEGRYERKFIGRTTKYRIESDSLRFYDLEDSVWTKGRLYKIVNDTLFLFSAGGTKEVFVKYKYDLENEAHFDQIVLSTSGCLGSCPVMNIMINSTGEIIFYGEDYVDKPGFYTGHISEETFSDIENEFRKAKVINLKRSYTAIGTDGEQISTTFCKDGKIINSVMDYSWSGPDELVWAYPLLKYLYQDVHLNKLDSSALPVYATLHYSYFQLANEFCFISKSEMFLLQNFLRLGTVTEKRIDKGYTLNFREYIQYGLTGRLPKKEIVKNIVTDGRYYTFIITDQKPITIDIGFNYLEVNKSFMLFKEIEE